MTDNFFSLIPNTEKVFDELSYSFRWIEPKETNKALDWYSANLAYLPRYDLEAPTVILGEARSGKSTLTLWLIKRYFEEKYANENRAAVTRRVTDVLNKHTFYSNEQRINPFVSEETPIWFDESYLTFDRRRSMEEGNISLTGNLNVFANLKCPVFALIQNLSDLDERIINKSNVILVYERGDAYVFMRHKNFPILKTGLFERIKKYPYLIRNKQIGKYSLVHLPNFAGTLNWIPLAKPDNPLDRWAGENLDGTPYTEDADNALIYHTYLAQKKRWQASV